MKSKARLPPSRRQGPRDRPTSTPEIHDAKLVTAIETIFKASDRTCGARRVWRDVLEEGLAWAEMIPFLALSSAIRKIIYIEPLGAIGLSPMRRNAVESLNWCCGKL